MAEAKPPVDLGDSASVADRNDDLFAREQERRKMMAAIMSLREGRAWVHELLTFCGVFRSPFASNALVMAHQVGYADVGRKILADVEGEVPDLYFQMLREKKEERNG